MFMLFVYMFFIIFFYTICFYRESGTGDVQPLSKCKMYDVNLTTIQSWDYADWNSTKHHENQTVLGKYWLK